MKVNITIPKEVADNACTRLFGLEATLRSAAAALESGRADVVSGVPDALEFLAYEISRLSGDLDVGTWDRIVTEEQS